MPGTKEIEITPEMVKAGARELVRYHPDYQTEEDAAHNIFVAMCEAITNHPQNQ